MNREELIAKVAERTGEFKKTIDAFVKAYEAVVEETLLSGEDVRLHGFVTYDVRDIAEKRYVNPKSGEESILPATKRVLAKVSARINRQF